MGTVHPYYEFLRHAADLNEASFLARFASPALYFLDLPELEGGELFTTIRIAPGAASLKRGGTQGLVFVQKAANSNAFAMMVTMGRAENNDLVIPDGRVSKFHAYFRLLGDRWLLTDANSTNGTRVDGVLVAPERSIELRSGSTLEFAGDVRATFLAPSELYRQVQADRVAAR